jgi:predicted RND superfamily exporter protein
MLDKEKQPEEKENNTMLKIATFIVDKRNLFFLLFGIAVIFSLVTSSWVNVENDLSAYLPDSAETSIALDLMDEEYITYGTADYMVANITYDDAEELADRIFDLDYVALVQFDSSSSHYNNFSALYSVTFAYDENDERCLESMDKLTEELSGYDVYVTTDLGDQASETISEEMKSITVVVAIIVVLVLLFTSDAYAEIPVLLITFLVAAALSSGTNYILGTISFVSDNVTIVLQLALSVDYAVIFLNKYKYEHRTTDARNAVIIALSKAITEISASSLTTIGGLIAMGFMQYGIGPDMAIVLIKSILLSLLSVFLLMPGLILDFSGLMEKTKHKSFIPQIPFVGKFAYKTRYVVPFVFVGLIIVGYYFSSNCPYVYGYSTLTTVKQSEQDKIDELIEDTFGSTNMVALNVPAGDYDKESKLITNLVALPQVDSATGLANTEAMDGVMLTDKLTAREFAELIDVDSEVADLLYAAYAINDEDYGKLLGGITEYSVPFIDMFLFLHDEIESGYVTLEDDQQELVDKSYDQIIVARNQLQGNNYDRILFYLNLPEEGDETFAFLDEMHEIARDYYGEEANIILAGNSTSQYDLQKTFARDNTVVNIVSMLAVLAVLLFTFKSAGMPILLIAVIEGCIWLNFSYPAIAGKNLFFMGYLIVSSIQMGANIDYAIVVSSRYQEVKKTMNKRDAIIDTMNYAFPTIATSGTMLAMAGIVIGLMTSEPCISGIGECLGRGTIISIIAVLFALPQILLFGDKIIDLTSFDVNIPTAAMQQRESGVVYIDGVVQGHIDGEFIGAIRGTIIGNVDIRVKSGNSTIQSDNTDEMLKIEEHDTGTPDAAEKGGDSDEA